MSETQQTAEEWSERMRAILSTHDVCFGLALIKLGDVELITEVADRAEQWKMGLKPRPKMRHDGMLFSFNKPQTARFTMTDVNFDLDVYWFDSDMNMVGKSSAKAGAPFVETPQGHHYTHALEVPAGSIEVPFGTRLTIAG